MVISEQKIKVSELCQGYTDDGDGGVYGYDDGNHKLTIRPAFQREFVYKDKQRDAVIETVHKGYPLNVMYWSKVSDTEFEVLDGQQRTISLGQYLNGDFAIKVNGIDKIYAFDEMQGDHILAWSKGGHTTEDNCQMLCNRCIMINLLIDGGR